MLPWLVVAAKLIPTMNGPMQTEPYFSWLREFAVPAFFTLFGAALGYIATLIRDERLLVCVPKAERTMWILYSYNPDLHASSRLRFDI